jgi:sugar lactone lactonase YvrE
MDTSARRSPHGVGTAIVLLLTLVLTLLVAPAAARAAPAAEAAAVGVDPAAVLYIALPDTDTIQMRDAASGVLLDTIQLPAGSGPEQLITAADSSAIFVLGTSWVGYIDPLTNTAQPFDVTVHQTNGMALTNDGTRLYVEDDGDPNAQDGIATLYEITVSSGAVRPIPLLSTDDYSAAGVAVSPDGATVYLSGAILNGDPQAYLEVAVATGQVTQVLSVQVHSSVAVSLDGSRLFLGRDISNENTVDVFDTATDQHVATWAGAGGTPRNARGLLRSIDGASLYVVRSLIDGSTGVTNAGVERVSTQDGTPLSDAWAATAVITNFGIAQSPDGSTVYVGDTDGTVTVLDASTLAVQTSWSAGAFVSSLAAAIVPRAPQITSPATVPLVAGTPANAPIDAVGSPTPTVTITGELPPGVVYTPGTFGRGALTGTPTTAGGYPVTVTAVNTEGQAQQQLSITVDPGAAARLAIVSGDGQQAAPDAQFGAQLRTQVTDADGNPVAAALPVTFTVTPAGAASFAGLSSITVTSGPDGIAVSPFLTAGPTTGPVGVTASSPGLTSAAFELAITGVPPGPPTIDSLAGGDAQVTVTFTPGTAGTEPTTGYRVTATNVTEPTRGGQTATGSGSPITVTGLTNGDSYTFTVTAVTASGDGGTSAPSAQLNVGVPPSVTGTPPPAVVGQPYSYTFTLAGAPAPTVAVSAGSLPDGLTLSAAGVLSGTPTTEGQRQVALTATNAIGSSEPLALTVTVRNALGEPSPADSLDALRQAVRQTGPAGRALASLVAAAGRSFEARRPLTGCLQLTVFIIVVRSFGNGRLLPTQQAQQFATEAIRIRAAHGCR